MARSHNSYSTHYIYFQPSGCVILQLFWYKLHCQALYMDDCSGIHSDTVREILEEFNGDDVCLINSDNSGYDNAKEQGFVSHDK